jgi:shikimate 5-dehydrogenase
MEGSSGWKGACTTFDAVDQAGQTTTGVPDWAGRGSVTVVGHSRMARGAAKYFSSRGAAVSIAGTSDNAAASIAREVGVRHVSWSAVHDQRLDTLVIADFGMQSGQARGQLNPGLIRERMTVVDLSSGAGPSTFADEARARGAKYVDPISVLAAQINLQFKTLVGRDLPADAFQKGLAE